MGKVISIMRNGAAAKAEERDLVLFDDSFLPCTDDRVEEMDEDLFKRITYEMMESELSVPLVKPMWPLCSSF